MIDPLERVLRPIVEGQLRSFVADHPEVADAVTWYKRRGDKTTTFVNSVGKRIIRDLLCAETRVRLIAAAVEVLTADAAGDEPVMASGLSDGRGGSYHCPGQTMEAPE